MSQPPVPVRHVLTAEQRTEHLARDVREGLSSRPRALTPRCFYDARGSELFERITELPEYYQTRTERSILTEHAADIAKLSAADTLVELGSGASVKTRLLLDGLRDAGSLRRYVPVDISESALEGAVRALRPDYPDVGMYPVVADFERHIGDDLDITPRSGARLVAFLGGTLGNLVPPDRGRFLARVRGGLGPGDTLLLGADLTKSPDRLLAAYDDAAGVTAEFNRNALRVVNRELAADFVPERFGHVAHWDAGREWIEMRLRADRDHTVHIARLDLTVGFAAGEELRTEISAKFRRDGLTAELAAAGLAVLSWWTDPAGDFALTLAEPT